MIFVQNQCINLHLRMIHLHLKILFYLLAKQDFYSSCYTESSNSEDRHAYRLHSCDWIHNIWPEKFDKNVKMFTYRYDYCAIFVKYVIYFKLRRHYDITSPWRLQYLWRFIAWSISILSFKVLMSSILYTIAKFECFGHHQELHWIIKKNCFMLNCKTILLKIHICT